jgi:hypothetical protein
VALDAAAVGLSISRFAVSNATAGAVREIRRRLPSRIRLWLGGGGAPMLDDVPVDAEVLASLDDLERAVRSLRD